MRRSGRILTAVLAVLWATGLDWTGRAIKLSDGPSFSDVESFKISPMVGMSPTPTMPTW